MTTPTTYGPYDIDNLHDGCVNPAQLAQEIADDADIGIGVQAVNTDGGSQSLGVITGGTLSVVFKDVLPSTQKSAWDGGATQAVEDPPGVGSCLALHEAAPTPLSVPKTQIINNDDTVWNQPQTTAGTPLYNPDILQPGYMLYVTGSFDDVTNEKRGAGDQMEKEVVYVSEPLTSYIEGQFFEHQYALGGDFGVVNPGLGDWVSMLAYAPASAPTDKTATHDGNANKVDTQLGFNIIVPAPGDDGDWSVDGATLYKGEINQNLVPVPNKSKPQAGYWNWDPDASPSITPVTNPATPDGSYDLYDVAMPLVRQANRVSALQHEKSCCPQNLRGKKFLPHWKLRFYAHRKATGTVGVAFSMKFGRKSTVNATDLL